MNKSIESVATSLSIICFAICLSVILQCNSNTGSKVEHKPTVLILDQRTDLTLYLTPIYIVEYMDTATMEYRYADFRSEQKLTQFLEYLDKIAIIEWLGVECD
jgi:hypothetical protein